MNIHPGLFTKEVTDTIDACFRRGCCVELKIEKGKLLVIEVRRKVKYRTSIKG